MKKTLLVTLEYPPDIGGVASYYAGIVGQLPKDTTVVLTNERNELLPWRKSFRAIKQHIRKHSIGTVLVGQILPLGTVAMILSYIYPIRYIVFVHGMDITVPQPYWRKRLLLKWILKRAYHVVAVSNYTASKITELTGSSSTPVTIISPGAHISPTMLSESNPLINGIELPKRYILSVGRLVERKGFDNSIEAFARIHAQFPDVHYVIAGSGSYEQRLRELIAQYGLESFVHIHSGLTDRDIAQLYRDCLFVCMPARLVNGVDFEGFGITVLEANAFGKPVVGGLNSGMTDAIQDGVTGWLVDGTDIDQITQALTHALGHPEITELYGKNALKASSVDSAQWPHKANLLQNIISKS